MAKEKLDIPGIKSEIDKASSKLCPDSGRLEFLDLLRGLCLLVMMAFHLFFIMGDFFGIDFGNRAHAFMEPIAPVFGTLFILIAGFCVRYSRDLSKRGLKLLIYALIISLVTIVLLPMADIRNMAVWFGILHLLAASKLLMALWNKAVGRIPYLIGLPLSLILFQFTSSVGRGYFNLLGLWQLNLPAFLYETNWLLPLGFHTQGFEQWDYFPLLPFLFVFLFGVFLGRLVKDNLPKFCYKRNIKPLCWLGRHSLIIYLLHMPVFYAILYIFEAMT